MWLNNKTFYIYLLIEPISIKYRVPQYFYYFRAYNFNLMKCYSNGYPSSLF